MSDEINKLIQEELDAIEANEAKSRQEAVQELTSSSQALGLYDVPKMTISDSAAKRVAQILLHPPPPNVKLIELMTQKKLGFWKKVWVNLNVWYWKFCFQVFRW
jgi:hypothetical protein